ncbi:MAG: glycosyltransferase family 2 protein [Thiotrichaceae bacterium]|nr:glycosyltransferase family 2 protein [Thiotrichaceae bacterium]
MSLISVIVTTYNWPEVLASCLNSLLSQHDKNFEIIIANDGSSLETQTLIERFIQQNSIPIKHAYHQDQGFRAGTIRNKAVALSSGDYLIFIDGDCVVFPNFVSRHRQLAEPGYFVPGNRILLTQSFTATALQNQITLHKQSAVFFISQWLQRNINRITPLIYSPFAFLRYRKPLRWNKAMTCNLAMFKKDFIAVNGFDEAFEGWGYEDSDLVIRLIHYGIKRKEGRFALAVLHHWHKQNDQSKHDENYQRLMQRLQDKALIRADQGLDQYS